ncbi:Uncharacterised protein [Vibrio cholerae]|nr:Uncharacterised protein [Vibrio cholerae]
MRGLSTDALKILSNKNSIATSVSIISLRYITPTTVTMAYSATRISALCASLSLVTTAS